MSKIYENEKSAESYDTARALPEHAISTLLNALRENTPVEHICSVLDLGGGTGRISPLLHTLYNCPVYTLDPSIEMLKKGVARNKDSIHWIRSVAESIPLKSTSVDCVFMSNVYHHLEDPDAAISEIFRVLTSEGNLIIRNGTRETDSEIEWLKFFPEAIEFDKNRIPRKQDIIDFTASNGFRCTGCIVVYQQFALSYLEYYRKISRRGLSSLLTISDEAFNSGCQRFREWANTQPPDTPVFEPIDYFFFVKD